MSTFKPDKWVIIKFNKEKEVWYKVLGTWAGVYIEGSPWRLSSGLERIEDAGEIWKMHNHSGSVYECHKEMEGVHYASSGVLTTLEEQGKEQGVMVKKISVKQFMKETKK